MGYLSVSTIESQISYHLLLFSFIAKESWASVRRRPRTGIPDYLNAAFSLSHASPGLSEMSPLIRDTTPLRVKTARKKRRRER